MLVLDSKLWRFFSFFFVLSIVVVSIMREFVVDDAFLVKETHQDTPSVKVEKQRK